MKRPYFVMLKHPNGEYFLPLVNDENEVIQFATEDEAKERAESTWMGSDVGYEIFDFQQGL